MANHSAPDLPQVFIVTPSLDSEEYIDTCIHSVLSQRGKFELHYHIQDGGSTDGTIEKIKTWQKKVKSGQADVGAISCHFTYATEPDKGIYDGIVKGFSSFDLDDDSIMAWINSDDVLLPNAVARASAALSLDEVDWILGLQKVHNEHGQEIWRGRLPYPEALIKAGVCDGKNWAHVQQEGSFWTYRLWKESGGLDTAFSYAGDWDLWRRFAFLARPVQLEHVLGAFTSREGQVSIVHEKAYEEEKERVIPLEERTRRFEEMTAEPERILTHKLVDRDGKKELCVAPITAEELAAFRGRERLSRINDPAEDDDASISMWDICVDAPALHRLYLRLPKPAQHLLTTIKYGALVPLRNVFTYFVLLRSGLFFPEYYRQSNKGVLGNNKSPLWHYILQGSREGRKPNPLFDDRWYLRRHPELEVTGKNPLLHFIRHGWRKGYDPSDAFSVSSYLKLNPDVRDSGVCPLTHYLNYGIHEDRIPL